MDTCHHWVILAGNSECTFEKLEEVEKALWSRFQM